ncbi:hypothetical protein [Paraburkholderia caffeinilytica]|uniref:hypothetical protein n=1 Tax=Paraburkholderia caffeinilytica TaxID=1761016 RepID=UPI003D9FD770
MSLKNVSLSAPVRHEMTSAELALVDRKADAQRKMLAAQASGRADEFGLIKRERLDDSNRKIREWDSVDGRKHWMTPFKQNVTHHQIAVWNRESSEQERQTLETNWRLARGLK